MAARKKGFSWRCKLTVCCRRFELNRAKKSCLPAIYHSLLAQDVRIVRIGWGFIEDIEAGEGEDIWGRSVRDEPALEPKEASHR
jgi:hypothetical protein